MVGSRAELAVAENSDGDGVEAAQKKSNQFQQK
jgi:hypothetical protein